MQKRLKEVYFEKFIEKLDEDKNIGLTDVQKRQISNLLSSYAIDVHDDNFKKLSALNQENTLTLEKSRSQFIGMINFIERSTIPLLDKLRVQGVVKVELHGGKSKMVGRSSVVTDMVKYINTLNELVIKFYKDIYQIEKVSDKDKEKDKIQASLF
jgi:hypothetical protein